MLNGMHELPVNMVDYTIKFASQLFTGLTDSPSAIVQQVHYRALDWQKKLPLHIRKRVIGIHAATCMTLLTCHIYNQHCCDR